MRRIGIILACVVILAGMIVIPGMTKKSDGCATIQGGTIVDIAGNPITTGYDQWGYNYQAHIFNGWYWNYSRPVTPWTKETLEAAELSNTWLIMKWSNTWLSNKSCDADNKLDRGYPTLDGGPPWNSSAAEGAWDTNHQSGSYIGDDGKKHKWTYFVKIVYPPGGAVDADDDGKDDDTGGIIIWGSYVIIQQVYNDPYGAAHGVEFKVIGPAGFGAYK